MKPITWLSKLWCATQFQRQELSHYAESYIVNDVRQGVQILGVVSFILLGLAAILYSVLGFAMAYVYTFSMLSVLALHITLSSKAINTTQMLYLLGMTLLVIAGTAFVLLAHKTGAFSAALLSSTVLLFMIVPLVPWGVREAAAVVVLVYLVFTLSTISVQGRFTTDVILLLQFLMLSSGFTTLIVVARNVAIRKHDIRTRFELELAHKEMEQLSYLDVLTGVWNRRYLEQEFDNIVQMFRQNARQFHLVLIDVDNFKVINDSYGHDYGDKALQHLTRVILQQDMEDLYVFRLGGDEFAMIFTAESPGEVLQDLFQELEASNELKYQGQPVPLHISTGLVSVDPDQEISFESLYVAADKALYSAKARSRIENQQSNMVLRKIC